jgi:hypothetical protein
MITTDELMIYKRQSNVKLSLYQAVEAYRAGRRRGSHIL